MHYGMYGLGYYSPFSAVSHIILWVFLILLIIMVFRRSQQRAMFWDRMGRGGWDKGNSPLDILKERYAKGEINKQEFEIMKKDLMD